MATEQQASTILENLSAGVLTITFNRPRQKNAFNSTMWREATEAFERALDDDAVRAIVVTGAGGAFSAGQDLAEMNALSPTDDAGGSQPGEPQQSGNDNGFSRFLDALCRFDKPLVAAVEGVGVGIGITLLLHCDYVYIARGARLRAPFVTLGVVPEAASSYLFAAIIGYRNAVDLLFESDFIDGERAVELGIGTHLCDREALMDAARARAEHLAAKPLGSLRRTKQLLLATRSEQVAAARRREDAAFVDRIGSPENIEAITAFFEKRRPDFSNVSSKDRES
ncbi:MAG: hypothetical protein E4H03_05960 [Myxococcales bacterium]|nr:MAG: hypothetical protein E4H03_05960 [Myxococcales bacterium]